MNFLLRLRSLLISVIVSTVVLSTAYPVLASPAQQPPTGKISYVSTLVDAQEHDGIAYFLYDTPASIKRYQFSTESWLPEINLPEHNFTGAFTVTPNNIYVAYGHEIYQYDLDGANETHIVDTTYYVIYINVVDQLLLIESTGKAEETFTSFDLENNVVMDREPAYYTLVGVSSAPSKKMLFGCIGGSYPTIIYQVTYDLDGILNASMYNPSHSSDPPSWKTWVSPDEKFVFDNYGNIYNSTDLTGRNELENPIDDLVFYHDLPIILWQGDLIAYSNTFIETGRVALKNTPLRIFIAGDTIYSFYENGSDMQVGTTDINALNLATPYSLADPSELPYVPDISLLTNDETVYLLSKQYQSIFRWNVPQRKYLSTIPLRDVPYTMTYSSDNNRLYIVYKNGEIYQINLDDSLEETLFAILPGAPCGLAMAENFLFACDHSEYWPTHSVISSTGQVVSTKHDENSAQEYAWSPIQGKLYFTLDNQSPTSLYWENIDETGVIGEDQSSPFYNGEGIENPVRVKPDGSIVLLGSGRIFDGSSLEWIDELANSFTDARWKDDDTLVSLRINDDQSQLQKWNTDTYDLVSAQDITGSPIHLFSIDEGWLAITNISGTAHFSIYSDDFALISSSPVADLFSTPIQGNVALKVNFTNLTSEGAYSSSLWDFGDGTTSTEKDPEHLYTKPGNFTVKLTVTGPDGSDSVTKTNSIEVRPVTAAFTPTTASGFTPLAVQFNNYSSGSYDSVLWDFGDGTTSTEPDPSHIYTQGGDFSVSLTINGPYGSDTVAKESLIHVTYQDLVYLPVVISYVPVLLVPGIYEYENLCVQYLLYNNGSLFADVTQCVPSVEIKENGLMVFNYSWRADLTNPNSCLNKHSDEGNKNMYIEDSEGNRYDHFAVGGDAGYVSCLESGEIYSGWFEFPVAKTKNTTFTFYDDDNFLEISPIEVKAVP